MKFDEFIKAYEADIKAFIDAFINLVKAVVAKLTGDEAADAE